MKCGARAHWQSDLRGGGGGGLPHRGGVCVTSNHGSVEGNVNKEETQVADLPVDLFCRSGPGRWKRKYTASPRRRSPGKPFQRRISDTCLVVYSPSRKRVYLPVRLASFPAAASFHRSIKNTPTKEKRKSNACHTRRRVNEHQTHTHTRAHTQK